MGQNRREFSCVGKCCASSNETNRTVDISDIEYDYDLASCHRFFHNYACSLLIYAGVEMAIAVIISLTLLTYGPSRQVL